MTFRVKECPRGHEYSEGNTYWYRGSRRCKKCMAIKLLRRRRLKTLKMRLINALGEELGTKTFNEVKEKAI